MPSDHAPGSEAAMPLHPRSRRPSTRILSSSAVWMRIAISFASAMSSLSTTANVAAGAGDRVRLAPGSQTKRHLLQQRIATA